jgi:hypothetical protein
MKRDNDEGRNGKKAWGGGELSHGVPQRAIVMFGALWQENHNPHGTIRLIDLAATITMHF